MKAGPVAAVLLKDPGGSQAAGLETWAYLTAVVLHLVCKEKPDLERFKANRWAAAYPENALQDGLEEFRSQHTRQQARRAA